MTAYTAIADSEIDPESPYTTTLATKNRDNPIAITEGASGAPNIAYAALDTWYSTLGAVGTYAWLGETTTTETAAGSTRAGSNLRYAGNYATISYTGNGLGAISGAGNGGTPSGTWQAMGRSFSGGGTVYPATLWLRIS
jgi:hypothetical protein